MSEYNDRPVFRHERYFENDSDFEPEMQWLENGMNYLVALTGFVIVQTFVLAFHFCASICKALRLPERE